MTTRRTARVLVVAAAVVAAGTLGLVASAGAPTSYAAASTSMAVLTVVAGLLLVAAGGVRTWTGRGAASAPAVVALGLVWWAPVWVGWDEGSALARSLALLVVPFAPALLLHLAAALPSGPVTSPALRRGVVAVYAVTAAYTALRAAVRDPFLDLYCWNNCSDNVLLVSAQPGLARALDTGGAAAGALVAATAAVVAVRRLMVTSTVGRRARLPVLTPVAAAAAATSAHSALLLARPPEDPSHPAFAAAYAITGMSLAAVGAAVAWLTADDERRARQLTRLATEPEPGGDLAVRLASALADPSVRVGYWLPDQVLVDRDGRPLQRHDGSAHVDIVRGDQPVARVWCDAGLVDTATLAREVGSAARLAVDNERLRAQMLAHVEQLRESRARVVETGDAARRRLERDLHDGAQQRLLALSLQLTVAQARASAAGDVERAEQLRRTVEQAQRVVAELRALAHGIYPAVLDQAGLDGALRALAEHSPLPVRVEPQPVPDSVPLPAARVVYLAAREAARTAAAAGADQLTLIVARTPRTIRLEVAPGFAPSTELDDRVGAAGGSIEQTNGMLHVEVPCE
jgi:signal transduction histidine kinase